MRTLLVLFAFCFLLGACKKKDTVAAPFEGFKKPDNFPAPAYNFTGNNVTKPGFELGKKLFYDGRLSRDGTITCGTCHISFASFSHFGHTVSHGIDGKLGTRNAPGLQNIAWEPFLFWDGGVFNLDLFPINPIENKVEMDEKMTNVVVKLKADSTYVKQFKAAFGTEEITPTRVFQALSQFMVMLISNNSKYDQMLAGTASFTADEKAGQQLFEQKCSSCHSGILFTDHSFRNNGLSLTNDLGRGRITLNAKDDHCFKVPSLRNVEKSTPYMHDGRFTTLEEVLNHYATGVHTSATLDSLLQTNNPPGISLNDDEKKKIILFLKTLTDETFIRNPLFAE